MLMKDGAVWKASGIDPFPEEVKLGALRRFFVAERPQVVNVGQNALQPDVSGLRRPRNDDPHGIVLLLDAVNPSPKRGRQQ